MKRTLYALISLLISFNCVCAQEEVAQYVNPFIGTSDDHGQTSPAAVVPFGMISAGPDTKPAGQAGYDYLAEETVGFSQSRISGIGCKGTGGNLRLMPFIQVDTETTRFDKRTESASAGYYGVRLQNGIKVAIAAARTSAIYQFTYPKDKKSGLRLDVHASFAAFKGEEHVFPTKNTIEGSVQASGTCDRGTYTFYYHIEVEKSVLTTSENAGRCYWNFETEEGETITVKVGLSTVSVANAKDNMVVELGGKSFNQVKALAYDAWNKELNVVTVTTRDQNLRTSFYTRLYHAFLNPANITDYASTYRGSDGKVYATSRDHYHGWSIWDTFRTKHPLLSIIQADRYSEIIFSLVNLFTQGKQDWATDTEPFPTVRTEHACILLLDALDKGLIKGESIELIFNEILHSTENLPEKSPDQILEKCYDYWAVSELAKRLNLPDIQARYLEKSSLYRTVWNEKFKIITEKSDVMHGDGLYEGTLWQYRWFVPHDLEWIVNALGGRANAISELDYFFANHLFNMGNQPDIQVPYLYYNLGEPWKAQKLVREILLEPTVNHYGTHDKWKQPYVGKIFKITPDGYLKEMDDDAGTMSSWFVLSSMGLFPVCPGVPYYWIQVPVFDLVTINLENGKKFCTEVIRKSEKDLYIQDVMLNGEIKNESWLRYDEIMSGGKLIVKLGEQPNKKWGNSRLGDLGKFSTLGNTDLEQIARFNGRMTNIYEDN